LLFYKNPDREEYWAPLYAGQQTDDLHLPQGEAWSAAIFSVPQRTDKRAQPLAYVDNDDCTLGQRRED
jgi:hypothetical protein